MICKNSNIVFREIHDSFFLIDISDNYQGDKCALYELNETGMCIWKMIDEKKTIQDIVREFKTLIVDEVDDEDLLKDISEYLNDLCDKGFLEMKENG